MYGNQKIQETVQHRRIDIANHSVTFKSRTMQLVLLYDTKVRRGYSSQEEKVMYKKELVKEYTKEKQFRTAIYIRLSREVVWS